MWILAEHLWEQENELDKRGMSLDKIAYVKNPGSTSVYTKFVLSIGEFNPKFGAYTHGDFLTMTIKQLEELYLIIGKEIKGKR